MGPVEAAIRGHITAGQQLFTPTGRGAFKVADIGPKGPVLLLGVNENPVRIPWAVLEGIPTFLSSSWRVIGSRYEVTGDPGTLDGYLKQYTKVATAGWVAVLLESAGVVQIDRRRPARVRVRQVGK